MRRAFKIKTTVDYDDNSFSIYSGETSGKVKTNLFYDMQDSYLEENYSWIVSCRRAPEYDRLAEKYDGCIAWKQGNENWEQDKGCWEGD